MPGQYSEMDFDKERQRVRVVGYIDLVIHLFSLFQTFVWFGFSRLFKRGGFFEKYFNLTTPYKMDMRGLERIIYFTIDFLISFLLIMVIGHLARPDRNEEVGLQRAKKTMPIYLALNFVIGLGYAIWRGVEHAWVGLVVGGIVRTVLWVVVAHFYCKIFYRSGRNLNYPEGRERNKNAVVAAPVIPSF